MEYVHMLQRSSAHVGIADRFSRECGSSESLRDVHCTLQLSSTPGHILGGDDATRVLNYRAHSECCICKFTNAADVDDVADDHRL